MSDTDDGLQPTATRMDGAFFDRVQEDDPALAALRAEEKAASDLIAEATGIRDERLLAELAGLGIRVETLSALTLIPLVAVAWADGEMDDAERKSALAGAASVGIEPGSISYRLLEIWLEEVPPPDLTNLWREFIRALCASQSSGENARLRENLLGRARQVASAAGDARNRAPHVSEVEEQCLADLSKAFGE